MLSFVFIKHTYPTSDVTICAEAADYVQHIFAKTLQLKEIVSYANCSVFLMRFQIT